MKATHAEKIADLRAGGGGRPQRVRLGDAVHLPPLKNQTCVECGARTHALGAVALRGETVDGLCEACACRAMGISRS